MQLELELSPESQTAWNSKEASSNIWSRLHLQNARFWEFLHLSNQSRIHPKIKHVFPALLTVCSHHQLWSALLMILANGKLNTLMNQVRMDDRCPIRWLTTVNRISCGEGFRPWLRETPLKERLVSAVIDADSAGVSPQPGPFQWSLF